MSISVRCGSCERSYRVKPEAAGGRFKCPSCGAAIVVPELILPEPSAFVPLEKPAPPQPAAELPKRRRRPWLTHALVFAAGVLTGAGTLAGFALAMAPVRSPDEPQTAEGRFFREVDAAFEEVVRLGDAYEASGRSDAVHAEWTAARRRLQAVKFDAYGPHMRRLVDASTRYRESPMEIGFYLHAVRKDLVRQGRDIDIADLIEAAIRAYDESPNRTATGYLTRPPIMAFCIPYGEKRRQGMDHETATIWLITAAKL